VIDVASSFATFAANGIYSKPYLVKKIFDGEGNLIYEAKEEGKRVFSKKVMADLSYALSAVTRNGTASSVLGGFPRPIAGKTGTSQDNASAWFTGYSPDLSTSVAFFRDSPKEQLKGIGGLNSITGGTFPARIWNSYMRRALAPLPITFFPKPAYVGGTRSVYVDVAKPTPKPTRKLIKAEPTPTPTLFNPKPVPLNTKKPLPITSNKPLPGASNKPIPNTSTKPIPTGSSGSVPNFSPKPIP
jgi:membrane peptidoglycan carboxypeptidase